MAYSLESDLMARLCDFFQTARNAVESEEANRGYLTFEIIASTHAHHGDMKVVCKAYLSGGSDETAQNVEMPYLSDAVAELMRRFSTQRKQHPICLPRAGTSTEPGEIPF